MVTSFVSTIVLALMDGECSNDYDTRQVPCMKAQQCARGTEPHSKDRQVNDFSTEPRMFGGQCGYFIAISYAEDKPAGPTVHEAPGWLR